MAAAPSALRSSVSRTAAASVSQKIRPSRVTFSNGITRTRAGWAAEGTEATAINEKTQKQRKRNRCLRLAVPSFMTVLFVTVVPSGLRLAVADCHLDETGRLARAPARDDFGVRAHVE